MKVTDSFRATKIIQLPYFMDNNILLEALYVKTSSDDRNGVAIRYIRESCSDNKDKIIYEQLAALLAMPN
ncbi:hypothetical protein [Allomuricauda sp. F6463D]|uniref:hypothetical protein n=1 Tax=Allomuricauda sp. F6463D TaxID=2926409 RepID=UPI001FF2D3D5|nr:hypothetical protein [Muricauda sp. F6463D]MCK0161008.1 hypothetical protein [Muricauda sp. F6463D]